MTSAPSLTPTRLSPLDSPPVSPPDDGEKYWYLGVQHRWLLGLQAVSFSLIAYSVMRFSTSDPRLLLFLAPTTLYAVTLVVSLLSGTRKRRITLAEHLDRVSSWSPQVWPSADVFLPTAGEPLDILANTYENVAKLQWPGDLNVYVLDDGARPEVELLAGEYGLHYRSRHNRGHMKKAGNLLFGFEQSQGDLILVLDADFVPRPDMLTELAPYFDDADVGIVQSPQFFDTDRSMPWLQRCAGATQELFYRLIQPSRDRVGAAICVGTSAVYRRASLIRSGGFAQISHSEDVHTGVKMLQAGLRVRYVPVLVSKGLCPQDPAAFLNQQYRWCTGSMSLLADRSFHESSAITKRQRISFWAGFLYYISTAVNSVAAPLPAIAMLWLMPDWVKPMNSIWLVGALLLWLVVLPTVMKGRWRLDVLRIQHLYSFAHLTAIAHILGGRTREWVPTGAAGASTGRTTPLATSIGRVVKTYVVVSQTLIITGLVRGVLHYGWSQYWAMGVLAVLAAYIQWPLLFLRTAPARAKAEPKTRSAPRSFPRVRLVPRQRAATAADRTAEAPDPRKFRPDIQGLRAIAVVLVVLYHAGVPYITGGYVGVDVFFVISGFLITSKLMREVERTGRISFMGFYAGRARRLLPPAAMVVVATLIFARAYDSIFNLKAVTTDAMYSAVYALNYHLAAKGVDYQHASDAVSPLQHLWSLAVEEQFYLFWPLVVLVVALAARRYRWPVLVAVTVGLIVVSLYFSITLTLSSPPYAYFSLHTRAWQLMGGALLAATATKVHRLPNWILIPSSWVGVALIVGGALTYDDATAFPGYAALLPVVGAMLVIIGGTRKLNFGAERILALRPMQGMGKVSYSWYLWHWPMVILIPIALNRTFTWQLKMEVMVLALWFSVLTLYLVENTALHSKLRKTLWLPVGLGLGATTVVAALVMAITIPTLLGAGSAAAVASGGGISAIQGQLADALSITKAPANLTPSVKGATSNQPISTADGCNASFLAVAQGPCIYGDPAGKQTLAIFGDSHMQQWLPAMDAEGKTLGWKVVAWTKSECPVAALGAYPNAQLGSIYSQCPKWRSITEKRIAALKPNVLVMSQSDQLISQVSNTEWADATAKTALRFSALKIPTIYLMDTPRPPVSGPQCIADHIDNIGACSFSVKEAFGVTSTVFDKRRDVLAQTLESQKIMTVDPQNYFCTRGASAKCPTIVGNMMVYRDGSHMSTTYSTHLASVIAPLFIGNSGPVPSLVDPFTGGTETGGNTSPSALQAEPDYPRWSRECIVSTHVTKSPECLISPSLASLKTPVTSNRVVLIGDSHAGQWFDPIQVAAAHQRWDTEVLNKSGCPLSTTSIVDRVLKRGFTECDTWRENTLQRLASEPKPQVIFVAQLNWYGSTSAQWEKTLTRLRAIGAPIVYLQDTPTPKGVPECIANNINKWSKCSFKRGAALLRDTMMSDDHQLAAKVSVNQYLCPGAGKTCPAVRGDTLLYRDMDGHITRTAMMRLAPAIQKQLLNAKIVKR